jgi:hypothetical protein
MGRISGLPGMGCAMGMVAPQFEQKRALAGNPDPQRLQNTAILRLLHPEG